MLFSKLCSVGFGFDLVFKTKYSLHISKSMKEGANIFKTEGRKMVHKDAVMAMYVHTRHFLVLIMLSQTLCLTLVVLSVVLKSHKEMCLQHV